MLASHGGCAPLPAIAIQSHMSHVAVLTGVGAGGPRGMYLESMIHKLIGPMQVVFFFTYGEENTPEATYVACRLETPAPDDFRPGRQSVTREENI